MKGPEGKHIFGMVKVGVKGQIVIPEEARTVFGIKPGDTLMLVGDETQGLAIITNDVISRAFQEVLKTRSRSEAEI